MIVCIVLVLDTAVSELAKPQPDLKSALITLSLAVLSMVGLFFAVRSCLPK